VYHFSPLCNLTRQRACGLAYGTGKAIHLIIGARGQAPRFGTTNGQTK
jgi:hypothetical protein